MLCQIFFLKICCLCKEHCKKMANGEDKVLVAYASKMKKKIAKYGENFGNDKFLSHVPIVLDL